MKETGERVSTPYDDLTYQVIGCAMAVHRSLGPGLRENSYQRALANSLVETNLAFEAQKLYGVYDDTEQPRLVGYYIPDFVVEEKVVVEKSAEGIRHQPPGAGDRLSGDQPVPGGPADQFWPAEPAAPACFPAQENR